MKAEWTKERIASVLHQRTEYGRTALEHAVLAIYARQTASEQDKQETTESNGIGFNGVDAFILSAFAKQIGRSSRKPGARLSEKQFALTERKIKKYASQLARIAAEKA